MATEQESHSAEGNDVEAEPEVTFAPVVQLPLVGVNTLEDKEDEVFKMRAKLFRYDSVEEPPIWKERGIGDIRMLKHNDTKLVRLIMRRDQVLKVCCNHYITPQMKLRLHGQSDSAFIWTTFADFSDEEKKDEILAIKFRDNESAEKFRQAFEGVVTDLVRDDEEFRAKLNPNPAEDDEATTTTIIEANERGDNKIDIDKATESLEAISISTKEDKRS